MINPLQRKIISHLEPLPTGHQDGATVGVIERGKFRLSETITGVLRSLRQGEPMIWDPWILKDGDVYRLFYLQGLEGQTPWWAVSKICGAISTDDMQHWQDLGTILEPNPANDWESGRIFAGCTYKEDGVYYLFYSAGGKELHQNEAIGLATSVDGLHYSRGDVRSDLHRGPCLRGGSGDHSYLLKPDEDDPWYGRSSWTGHFHWRDPYIFKDPQTGNYYMFICASSKTPGKFQGCIGLAVADKISGPYQLLPPAVAAADTAKDWPYYHMERPQVIYQNGKYHLFFSCFKMFFNPSWLQKVSHQRITNSSLYWYVSDRVTGPYTPVNQDEFIVRGSDKTGMYGTNFLQTSTTPVEFIAYGWYHRLHALEVSGVFRVAWNPDPLDYPGDNLSGRSSISISAGPAVSSKALGC